MSLRRGVFAVWIDTLYGKELTERIEVPQYFNDEDCSQHVVRGLPCGCQRSKSCLGWNSGEGPIQYGELMVEVKGDGFYCDICKKKIGGLPEPPEKFAAWIAREVKDNPSQTYLAVPARVRKWDPPRCCGYTGPGRFLIKRGEDGKWLHETFRCGKTVE